MKKETAGLTRRYEELKTRVSKFHSRQLRLLEAQKKLTDEINNLVAFTRQFHSQRRLGSKRVRDAANEFDYIFKWLVASLVVMGIGATVAGGVGVVSSSVGPVTGGGGFAIGAAGFLAAAMIGGGGVTAAVMYMRKKFKENEILTDANNWIHNEDRPGCEQLLKFIDSCEKHWQELLAIFPDRIAMATHFRQHGIDLEKTRECFEELSEVGRRWRRYGFGLQNETDTRKAEEFVRTYLQEKMFDPMYLRAVTLFLDLENIGAIGSDVTYLKRKKPPIREFLMAIADGLENDAAPAKRLAEDPGFVSLSSQ